MSAAERAIKASSAEQENKWGVQANEQVDKRMAQYYTRRFHTVSIHSAAVHSGMELYAIDVFIL